MIAPLAISGGQSRQFRRQRDAGGAPAEHAFDQRQPFLLLGAVRCRLGLRFPAGLRRRQEHRLYAQQAAQRFALLAACPRSLPLQQDGQHRGAGGAQPGKGAGVAPRLARLSLRIDFFCS